MMQNNTIIDLKADEHCHLPYINILQGLRELPRWVVWDKKEKSL